MTNAPDPTKPLPERKPLQTFALHAIFVAVLLSIWPGLDAVYAYGFEAAGDRLLGNLGESLRVEYRWVPPIERDDEGELEMLGFVAWQADPVWESRYSVRGRGYTPTAVLIGLMLATPGSRRRHLLGTVLAVATLNVFYLLQTGLLSASLFAAVEPQLIPMGGALAASHSPITNLFGSPIPRYAAVFVAWAAFAAPARGLDISAADLRPGRLFGAGRTR